MEDPEVSRRHLVVTIRAGGPRVADAGSTNGTLVDGEPIEAEVDVTPQQRIGIGGSTVMIAIAAGSQTELPPPRGEWELPIGFDDRGAPVLVDLAAGHLLVIGPYKSGRSTSLARLATAAAQLADAPEIHLLSPRRSPLTERTLWTSAAVGRDEVELAIAGSGRWMEAAGKTIVFIDDGEELLALDDRGFEDVIRASRDSATRFVIAIESTEANRTFGGWLIEAKKQKHGLLLQPDPIIDGQLFGVELPTTRAGLEPGHGYLVTRSGLSFVRVADVQ
jgi:S-DNA-T family DNA segregation ATPase FtsK/SpoIIIE